MIDRITGDGVMIHVDSEHPAHQGMYKTLDLLRLDTVDGSIFFVVESCEKHELTTGGGDDDGAQAYFYEEGQCPTNFIPVEAILTTDDDDPHGLFTFVRSAWMTTAYKAAKSQGQATPYLRQLFPETRTEPDPIWQPFEPDELTYLIGMCGGPKTVGQRPGGSFTAQSLHALLKKLEGMRT